MAMVTKRYKRPKEQFLIRTGVSCRKVVLWVTCNDDDHTSKIGIVSIGIQVEEIFYIF